MEIKCLKWLVEDSTEFQQLKDAEIKAFKGECPRPSKVIEAAESMPLENNWFTFFAEENINSLGMAMAFALELASFLESVDRDSLDDIIRFPKEREDLLIAFLVNEVRFKV